MHIPLPRRADGSFLPAVLSGLLVLALAVQFALPSNVELPEGYDAAPRRWPRRDGFEIKAQPVILDRALFTPTRSNDGGAPASGESAAAAPLGGASVLGMAAVGRRAMIVLRTPAGITQRLAVGGVYQDWWLAGVTREAAIFRRGDERIAIPFGAAAPPADPASQEEQPEEEQQ